MSLDPAIRLPSIDALRALEAAVRLGSLERAAESLHITASAVAKRLSTLEQLLGTPLLLRSGKTLLPTPAGKEYLEQVRTALDMLAAVPLHRRPPTGLTQLRVCVPPTFARQILVPALGDFTGQHPDIELEVVLSIPYLDMSVPDADIEVRNGDARLHGGKVLLDDIVLPVAAPGLFTTHPQPRQPRDLRALPLLRSPLEPWTPWFQAAGLAGWPEPTHGPKLIDLGMLLEAAVCGQGVALARPSLAHTLLDSGALRVLFPISVAATQQYYLMPPAASAAARRFADWLTAWCERLGQRARESVSRLD